jgi:hypothetical protein
LVDEVLWQSACSRNVDSIAALIVHDRRIRTGFDQQVEGLQPFEASGIKNRRLTVSSEIESWPILQDFAADHIIASPNGSP